MDWKNTGILITYNKKKEALMLCLVEEEMREIQKK